MAFQPPAAKVALVLGALAAAAAVIHVNLRTACEQTELQALVSCEPAPVTRSQQLGQLDQNPGDAWLAAGLARDGAVSDRRRQLAAAGELAPREPNLLLARARDAAASGELVPALGHIVALARHSLIDEAVEPLAKLVGAGGSELLVPYLLPDLRWPWAVTRRLAADPQTLANASPFIVAAYRQGAMDRGQVEWAVRTLLEAHRGVEAHAIWAALHPEGLPQLQNADFRSPLNEGPFDWTTPRDRSGMTAVILNEGPARMLEMRFSGRAFEQPLLRQYIMVSPGSYAMAGEWRSKQLRLEQGLEWVLRCSNGTLVRTGALPAAAEQWGPFSFDLKVDATCGPSAALELRSVADYESRTGTTGRAAFRHLRLAKRAN